jgi:guanidinoacetate N-methyltransferase
MKDKDLIITQDSIVFANDTDNQVMMRWEDPLMAEHANHLAKSQNTSHNILEIGFGLGISSQYIYDLFKDNPNFSHTIYEIHPDIANLARLWAADKPEVTIVEKDWATDIVTISSKIYDGIFYDAHVDPNAKNFRSLVVNPYLSCGGVFTYFSVNEYDIYSFGTSVHYTYVNVNPTAGCKYFKETSIPCPYYIKNC